MLNQLWDFLSIHFSPVAQDMAGGGGMISCLDCFKQHWIGWDVANVLPCHFLENLEVFTLEALCPLSDVQTAPGVGMLGCLCTWGPGLYLGPRVRRRGWVMLGHPWVLTHSGGGQATF